MSVRFTFNASLFFSLWCKTSLSWMSNVRRFEALSVNLLLAGVETWCLPNNCRAAAADDKKGVTALLYNWVHSIHYCIVKKLQIRSILFLILLSNVVCCNPVSTESLFYLWTQQLIGLFTIRFHSFVQHVPQLSTQIPVSISNDAWIFSMESVKRRLRDDLWVSFIHT